MSGDTIVIGDMLDHEQAPFGGAAFVFEKSPRGNMNCDLFLDALDIEPFILAIFDPDEYANRYPDCDINRADVNLDGAISGLGIEPFLELLSGARRLALATGGGIRRDDQGKGYSSTQGFRSVSLGV